MKYAFLIVAVISLIAVSALAEKPMIVTAGAAACGLKENITISVSFSKKANSFAEAKKLFDEQVAKISEFAKAQSVSKLEVQNQNYSISSNPRDYGDNGQVISYNYQLSGSTSYKMDNSNLAFKFAEFLTNQKMQVSLSSDAYREGNCSGKE